MDILYLITGKTKLERFLNKRKYCEKDIVQHGVKTLQSERMLINKSITEWADNENINKKKVDSLKFVIESNQIKACVK